MAIFAGDDATVVDNFSGELGVFFWVDFFDFGAEDGDGFAAAGESAARRDGVDAVGETGDDDNSLFGECFSEFEGDFFPVFSVFASADDGDGFNAFFGPLTVII